MGYSLVAKPVGHPKSCLSCAPKEEKILLHLSDVNRKEKKTFIDLTAKKTQTEMHE